MCAASVIVALRTRGSTSILDRRKQGFGVPSDVWFRTSPRELFADELLSAHAEGRRDHAARLWALLVFELWHRRSLDARPDRIPQRPGVPVAVLSWGPSDHDADVSCHFRGSLRPWGHAASDDRSPGTARPASVSRLPGLLPQRRRMVRSGSKVRRTGRLVSHLRIPPAGHRASILFVCALVPGESNLRAPHLRCLLEYLRSPRRCAGERAGQDRQPARVCRRARSAACATLRVCGRCIESSPTRRRLPRGCASRAYQTARSKSSITASIWHRSRRAALRRAPGGSSRWPVCGRKSGSTC